MTPILSSPPQQYDVPVRSLIVPPLTQPRYRLSLIIPTYQECQTIQPLLHSLTGLLDAACPEQYELIVVDDNSPDGTAAVVESRLEDYPAVRLICRTQERGLSTAVIRGWQQAQGEYLGVIDADLQHPPEILLALYQALEAGADLAVASRHVPGGGVSDWNLGRRVLSRGAQALGWLILPRVLGAVSDPLSGYFMVRRDAIASQRMNPVGYKILIEVLARGQCDRIQEVSYVFQERQDGESKVTYRQYLEYLQHLARLRWERWFCQRPTPSAQRPIKSS
ncbi:polyprenol monophosphomannose synthase [Spirulina major CS-329]|uniref:polyprenol monophosphomannose synthase n=1 Tax=Spirulina TaxID=1154 RepID=UPI00232E35EB|nr:MULTISPECIES: polyprenol monophosphomannose synthase [Spirulina]MDB9494671.1 polyprenol monophosphomannose synthase [Spirulina subsalsa CS-330]MDB9501794.1 polyprenol monophosphomannose synthase [Spirulina major CS-329]